MPLFSRGQEFRSLDALLQIYFRFIIFSGYWEIGKKELTKNQTYYSSNIIQYAGPTLGSNGWLYHTTDWVKYQAACKTQDSTGWCKDTLLCDQNHNLSGVYGDNHGEGEITLELFVIWDYYSTSFSYWEWHWHISKWCCWVLEKFSKLLAENICAKESNSAIIVCIDWLGQEY